METETGGNAETAVREVEDNGLMEAATALANHTMVTATQMAPVQTFMPKVNAMLDTWTSPTVAVTGGSAEVDATTEETCTPMVHATVLANQFQRDADEALCAPMST